MANCMLYTHCTPLYHILIPQIYINAFNVTVKYMGLSRLTVHVYQTLCKIIHGKYFVL